MKRKGLMLCFISLFIMLFSGMTMGAYHHTGEADSPNFVAAYPGCEGTKLDSCSLCHCGGEYEKKPGKWVTVGSCQWCYWEEVYGYHGTGDIELTLNNFGKDYQDNGRNAAAFPAIENIDSDGDGYNNKAEIDTLHYPGDAGDDPTKIPAPRVTYSMSDLESLPSHTEFLLMKASRQDDSYTEYQGVTIAELLNDIGILDSASSVTVFAPDGYSYTYDFYPGGDYYYVYGTYPQAQFYYDTEADLDFGGSCDSSAPSCICRNHGDLITVENGLQLILAYKRDGAFLDPGFLDETNRLEGEGPFRAVPPQMVPGSPDQSSKSSNQNVCWPYDEDSDHNAGFSCRTVVAVRVEPLPDGTTDLNWYEGGWDFVDNQEVIVYGAIKSGDFKGKVTDQKSKEAVSSASITSNKGGYSTKTDSNGEYSINGMKPGIYTITVSATGYNPKTQLATIAKDTLQTANFSLKKASAQPCPIENFMQGETAGLELIRQFRDQKLAGNDWGKRYIVLYYRHAPEVLAIALSSRELPKEMKTTIQEMFPLLKDILDGREATISDNQLKLTNELLDKFAAQGSKKLKTTIEKIKNDLQDGDLLKRLAD